MFVIAFLPRSKRLLISRHKINLNKLKRTENISSIFSEHNYMKGKINHRKRKEKKKKTITWRLNNMLLKTHRVNNEIKEEILKYLEANNNEKNYTKSMGYIKSSS